MERLQKYFGPYITIGMNGTVYITGDAVGDSDAVGEGNPTTFISDLFTNDIHNLYEKNYQSLVIPSVPVILSNIMIKINDMSFGGDMRCARWMANQFPNIQFKNCFYVQKNMYEEYRNITPNYLGDLENDWTMINDRPTITEENAKFKTIMLARITDFKS